MREIICPSLCRYYKPQKAEEPGCGGLVWLSARPFLKQNLASLDLAEERPLFGLADDDPRLWAVCQTCEYLPDGCDFRDPSVARETCSPCGGLRAVAGLLASGLELRLLDGKIKL